MYMGTGGAPEGFDAKLLADLAAKADGPVIHVARDDARLAAVLNWMLTRFDSEGLPHDFAPYEADEVAALRAAPLINVKSTRAALLRSIEAARSDVEGARP